MEPAPEAPLEAPLEGAVDGAVDAPLLLEQAAKVNAAMAARPAMRVSDR
jgi:hypothetical protein